MIQFLPTLAMNAMGIGTALNVMGSLAQGNYAAGQYMQRADVLTWDAAAVRKATEYEASQIQAEGRRLRARQIVQFAKSGVMPDGTPKLVMAASHAEVEKEAALTTARGIEEAWKLKNEARQNVKMAQQSRKAGIWNAIGQGLQGASEIGLTAYRAGYRRDWG